MSRLSWPIKDPNEVLDNVVDWSDKLGSDTISSSTWTDITPGITIVSSANTTTQTSIWFSGGTSGHSYNLTNRIITAGGRTMDQMVRIEVWDR